MPHSRTLLFGSFLFSGLLLGLPHATDAGEPRSYSGIYPHLAMFNDEGECGTGAVVPWANRLWVVTYSPHRPLGSTDKLYEITPDLRQIIRPESVGGTPASRMIHRESRQLFIGPYAIDEHGLVRALRPQVLPGRLTGAARHLWDPAGRIYLATMEEGLHAVDVRTLEVVTPYPDAQAQKPGEGADLPGCHGKGLYSGQGVLVYANNGELGEQARVDPRTVSGALMEWNGVDWTLVRRNQFTEVSGPGGLQGNADPANDPIWSIGWDDRSLILMLRDRGRWHSFRLPKASHAYDGAHGWNTEWPRIRDVGPEGRPDLLMTMHGMFWRFPISFSAANTAGLRPRSSYLKVIGDFCRFGDRLVFGCDDTARSEFLNRRKAKGSIAGPGQSQSNLWFTDPGVLDRLGGTAATGAVWLRDRVEAGEVSEPFLFAGWPRRSAFLANGGSADVRFALEVDLDGTGTWRPLRAVDVPAGGSVWTEFLPEERGEWLRVRSSRALASASVVFTWGDVDRRTCDPERIFEAVARVGDGPTSGGWIRAAGFDRRTLELAAMRFDGTEARDLGYHELDAEMRLEPVSDDEAFARMKESLAVPRDAVRVDEASVLVIDDGGRRWRLPKGSAGFDALTVGGLCRIAREVCTERDLLNVHGTIYELPAENAGGFARLRPIASHELRIQDFGSWRGLLVLTGIRAGVSQPRVIRSEDGRAAVWVGAVDDLWQLGRPVGRGGPWKDSELRAGEVSDPYLFAGYETKRLRLSQASEETVRFRVEVDPTGGGLWLAYRTFEVEPGRTVEHVFPPAFQARWIRFTVDRATRATAWLTYE